MPDINYVNAIMKENKCTAICIDEDTKSPCTLYARCKYIGRGL